jgi:hypothetical protein
VGLQWTGTLLPRAGRDADGRARGRRTARAPHWERPRCDRRRRVRDRNFNQLGRTYDVSLDGKRFLRIKLSDASPDNSSAPVNFVVVQNWFEELKRLVPAK